MKAKKFIISGILAGIVIFVITQVVSYLASLALPFNVLELAGMRSAADPIMPLFFLYPWVLGFAMAYTFGLFEKAMPLKSKGLRFGLAAWLLAGFPSFWIVFSSMDYPAGFSISSLVGSFIAIIAAGIVIAKFE